MTVTAADPDPLDPAAIDQQLADDLEAVTDAQTRALVAAWALAWSEVSADLTDALTEAMADGAAVTLTTVVRVDRLARVLAQIADRLDDLATAAGITITTDLADVVDRAVDGQVQLMAAQVAAQADRATRGDAQDPETADQRRERLGIDRRPRTSALDAIVQRFTDRVLSDLAPVADETYEVIQRELTRGVAVGDNPRITARRMVARAEDHFNFGLQRALVVSRTETLDAYRTAAAAQQDEHAGILAGWVWLAHLGPRTCRSCIANHGQVFTLDIEGPIDHQQGRCSRTPLVAEDDGSVDMSWVPDAETFFAGLTAAEQVGILGKAGFRAWQRGEFPMSAWTQRRTADGWRDSMVPASPADRAPVAVAG